MNNKHQKQNEYVMPQSFGEFGHESTNPIPTKSVDEGYDYLEKLRTTDGIFIRENKFL
jgi:hypothetical protein